MGWLYAKIIRRRVLFSDNNEGPGGMLDRLRHLEASRLEEQWKEERGFFSSMNRDVLS